MDATVARVLWTGGWDSTFRLLQLAMPRDVLVEPHYIIDTARRSTPIEIRTMSVIREDIRKCFPGADERILPTRFFSIHEIAPDHEITGRYQRLKALSHLGTQYDWLARYAKQQGLDDLELTIEAETAPHLFIKRHLTKRQDPTIGEYYSLDPDLDRADDLRLFDCFRFPLLDWTKIGMLEHAKQHGWLEILMATWFCQRPRKGKPCGVCNPCRNAIKEGMGLRFSRSTLIRNKLNEIMHYPKRARRKAKADERLRARGLIE